MVGSTRFELHVRRYSYVFRREGHLEDHKTRGAGLGSSRVAVYTLVRVLDPRLSPMPITSYESWLVPSLILSPLGPY